MRYFIPLITLLLAAACKGPSNQAVKTSNQDSVLYHKMLDSLDELISFQRIVGDTMHKAEAFELIVKLQSLPAGHELPEVDLALRKGWLLAKENLLQSFEFMRLAIKKARSSKSEYHIGQAYLTSGMLMEKEVDFNPALQYYIAASNYFKLARTEEELATCYSKIGSVLALYVQYPKALEYLSQAIQLFNKHDDLVQYAKAAERKLLIELRSGMVDSAQSTLNAMELRLNATPSAQWLVVAYCHVADMHANSGAPDSALFYLEKVNRLISGIQADTLYLTTAEMAWAKYHTQIGASRQALEKLHACQALADMASDASDDWVLLKQDINLAFYAYYLSLNEGATANAYLAKYNELNIQIQNNLSERLSAMVRVLEAEKEENYTIASLQDINEKQRRINEEQNTKLNYLILIAGILVVVVGLVYYRYKQRKNIARYLEYQVEQRTQELKAQAEEKSLMLKEIHHRVKNNLQLISSFLNLQRHYGAAQKSNEEIIFETQERVRCMAIIHEKLYSAESLSKLDTKAYLSEIASFVHQSYSTSSANIEVVLHIESVHLPLDKMIPCGLIINELMSNCFKYAFKGRMGGTVEVHFGKEKDIHVLLIKDNGIGLPDDFAFDKLESLGMNIVMGLVEQLDGKVDVDSQAGTEWIVSF